MSDESGGRGDELPDFTPLYEAAKELGPDMVLSFIGRIGANPYLRWTDDGWEGMSVGPWDRNEEGNVIMSAKEIDVTDEDVRKWLEEGPIVELVWYSDTPFDGYESWEYSNPGE